MNAIGQVFRLCFWGSLPQRVCTVAGFGLALVMSLPATQLGVSNPLPWIMNGVMIASLPLMLFAGPMWRAVTSQRAVLLAPRARRRLLAAAVAVAAAMSLTVATFQMLASLPWIMDMLQRASEHSVRIARADGIATGTSAPGPRVDLILAFLSSWPVLASSFAFAAWWSISAFFASRSPLAGLIVLIVLVIAGTGGPPLATVLADAMECRQNLGPLCAAILSLQVGGPPHVAVGFAVVAWSLFGLWYLRTRRIAPPGWLLPGGQSLLASATVDGVGRAPPTRTAALESVLLGGSGIASVVGQWLLAAVLLVAMLLTLALRVDGAYVAWVLRAMLVATPVIVLALSLAVRQRARTLWLPAALDRAALFTLVRNTLLKLALGLAFAFALLPLAQYLALPWSPQMSLPQVLIILLAVNLLCVGGVLSRAAGWAGMALAGAGLLFWWVGFAAPLLRGWPASWFWPVVMLAAGAGLLLLARRRWLQADLPGRTA